MLEDRVPMSVKRAAASAIVASVLVGGVAFAATELQGTAGQPSTDETPTSLTPDSTTPTSAPEEEAADAAVERWYDGCGDFTEGTHGDYVSQAAHAQDRTGQSVSEAAKSPCGKPVSAVEGDPSESEPEDEGEATPSAPSALTGPHGRSGEHGGGAPETSPSSEGHGPKH